MRVLEVINRLNRGGGAEKFVLDLTIAFNGLNDVEADVISLYPPLNNDFTEQLIHHNISHHSIGKHLRSFTNIFRVAKFIREGNYDAVHVHLFPALYIVGLAKMLGLIGKTRIYYTEHSTTNRRRNHYILRFCDRIIYRQYNGIVTISDKVQLNLAQHINTSDISIINNGIDLQAIKLIKPFNLRSELNIPDDAFLITMVGRFIEGKDFNTLISTLAILPTNFHIVCVGDGPTRKSVKTRFKDEGYAKRIHYLGLRKDVIAILKSSDISVLSTEHEGFSISMLESMACGLPFVASAVPGIKDLVDGVAELFEYQNSDQLSKILLRLNSDKTYYQSVANRCSDFASRYDIKNTARKYLKEFLN